jgi:hypothetical protein
LVSFTNRPSISSGAFYDYTARYGALRDDDRITLRQSILPESPHLSDDAHGHTSALVSDLANKLGLTSLLDLPLVALSHGQTRRARILKALIAKPELLLLDEPLSTSLYRLFVLIVLTRPKTSRVRHLTPSCSSRALAHTA